MSTGWVLGWASTAHHVGSLHIYEADLEKASALTGTRPSEAMPAVTRPRHGFDELLSRAGYWDATGHPGWDVVAET